MLIRYCASATESGFPEIVMVLSEFPLSRSSQFEMRIIAPDICRISAIFVPPLPMMQPINSFGTVMLCVWWFWFCCCCWFLDDVRNWEPAKAASAGRTKSLWTLWKGVLISRIKVNEEILPTAPFKLMKFKIQTLLKLFLFYQC